jgi:O-antigen/teichoic acid export membrane protein
VSVFAAFWQTVRSVRAQRRGLAVLTHAANGLAVPLAGPLFAFLVIRFASLDLWGEFVRALIVAQLAAHIAGWGNKDYLLREFSRFPGRLAVTWQKNLITRLLLLAALPVLLLLLGFLPVRAGWLALCALGLLLDQAYDVVVLYRRAFVFALVVEVAGVGLLALPILWLGPRLDGNALLAIFALSNLAKAAVLALRFRALAAAGWAGGFDLGQLRAALPFFLLGFSGLLQSRADLYTVSVVLSERALGQYQVFSNLMLYGQAVAGFILLPFVKSLYRLSYQASLRLALRLAAAGLAVLALFLPAAHLTLIWLYRLELPPVMLLFGGLTIWPIFFYLPIIYALFKVEQPSLVIAINLLGVAVSVLINLALLPRWGLVGAAAGAAAAQWVMGLAYVVAAGVGRQHWEREAHAVAVSELPHSD